MKRKILSLLLVFILIAMLFVLTGCGKNASSVTDDLNKMVKELGGSGANVTLSDIQKYFEEKSDYRLIDGANKEFTERPEKPSDKFGSLEKNESYVLRKEYSLVYDTKKDVYYSIAMGANGNLPYFSQATIVE